MRITVEIEDAKIAAIQKWTKERKKSPALVFALDEYLVFKRRQALVDKVMAGETDYQTSNQEIETLAHLEP